MFGQMATVKTVMLLQERLRQPMLVEIAAQGTQVIVVNDTTDPVLVSVPADITINCG